VVERKLFCFPAVVHVMGKAARRSVDALRPRMAGSKAARHHRRITKLPRVTLLCVFFRLSNEAICLM